MFGDGLTHRRLNPALSGDAELFEQLSGAHVLLSLLAIWFGVIGQSVSCFCDR
jgi:hypothetical protein